ncbi:uncharacterized protein Cgl0966/cg1103 [Arthrobacter sp. Hiyo8]|nr:uncharacterized protein Cgl0966/cg1103 [Arthrobacter sp. Hiyo8]
MLLSLLLAASAIGPVVAGLIPHAVGPLSILRFLFTNIQPVDPQALQNVCSDPAQAKDCAVAQLQLRAGAGGIFMAILPSFLLLLLAEGLRRGRRFAWVGTLLIQVGLSVLAGIALAGVLQQTTSDTGASEGIVAIEGSASSQPFTFALPLLLPLALTIILLATRRLFHVQALKGPTGASRSVYLRWLPCSVPSMSAPASCSPRTSPPFRDYRNYWRMSRTASFRWASSWMFPRRSSPKARPPFSCTRASASSFGRSPVS